MLLYSLNIFKISLFSNTKWKKIVAIGHVDTGKACLCGHLLYKCDYVDEHSMNEIKDKAEKNKMGKCVHTLLFQTHIHECRVISTRS